MASGYHLSDILTLHLNHYQQQHTLTAQQSLVCQHIQRCRTQELGEQLWRCGRCLYEQRILTVAPIVKLHPFVVVKLNWPLHTDPSRVRLNAFLRWYFYSIIN
jgi:hypothetical protein